MNYVKTVWKDEIFDPMTGEVVIEGTPFTASRINNVEEGIENLDISQDEQDRRISRLELKIALLDRSNSNNVFYDTLDGKAPLNLVYDTANADILTASTIGTTVLSLDSTVGFATGTEVTIYDDVNQETAMITNVNVTSKQITIGTALKKAYKKGAKIARSTVKIDTVNQKMKLGEWGTYTVAVSEVI